MLGSWHCSGQSIHICTGFTISFKSLKLSGGERRQWVLLGRMLKVSCAVLPSPYLPLLNIAITMFCGLLCDCALLWRVSIALVSSFPTWWLLLPCMSICRRQTTDLTQGHQELCSLKTAGFVRWECGVTPETSNTVKLAWEKSIPYGPSHVLLVTLPLSPGPCKCCIEGW